MSAKETGSTISTPTHESDTIRRKYCLGRGSKAGMDRSNVIDSGCVRREKMTYSLWYLNKKHKA